MKDTVNFYTANLAKKALFNEYTLGYFYPEAFKKDGKPYLLFDDYEDPNHTYYEELPEGKKVVKIKYDDTCHLSSTDLVIAPTKKQLCDWLLKEHNIKVNLYRKKDLNESLKRVIIGLELNEEPLVGFETSKLIKDKKFNIYTKWLYFGRKEGLMKTKDIAAGSINFEKVFPAPSLAILQAWLRLMYDINVIVIFQSENKYAYNVFEKDTLITSSILTSITTSEYIKEYNEAFDLGLQEALKIIKV